jgi:hypothetical protein
MKVTVVVATAAMATGGATDEQDATLLTSYWSL